MSGQASGWVLRHGPRPHMLDRSGEAYGLPRARAMRAVLVTIADAANRDGQHAHPGMAAIVDGSLYSEGHVRRTVADLVAERWVEVEEEAGSLLNRGGRGRATVYRVLGVGQEPAQGERVSDDLTRAEPAQNPRTSSEKGAHQEPKPAHAPSQIEAATVYTTKDSTLNAQRDDDSAFEEYWQIYPRRTAKGAARIAWRSALKKATAEVIIAGAKRYRDDPNLPPAEFIKHPTTWLNGECWADEPLPARNGRRSPGSPPPVDPDRGIDNDRDGSTEVTYEWLWGEPEPEVGQA